MMSLPWNDQVNKSHSLTVSFLFTTSVRAQVPAAVKETTQSPFVLPQGEGQALTLVWGLLFHPAWSTGSQTKGFPFASVVWECNIYLQ